MAQLKELKANRGYVKGAISRLETFCTSNEFATATLEVLAQKKERVLKAFNDYEAYNRAILAIEPEDGESYELYESKCDLCIATLNTRLHPAEPPAAQTTASTSSGLEAEKRAIALEATMTEEPKKPVKSVVSAAAATGVSCVPVCVPAADICGSIFGEDEVRSYCRRGAALPCWQEVYK
ncbi:uncharacterized protein LOC134647802 isoform X2 [Cydia amplana]|uniref:uncharacterized protein LOC134647802 isoform X2 n=1 Tax=Cydia amplana TaxID=1869771 RepID=UPI002FE50777